MSFRSGINLGDIIIDGDDIHGDGVNIAARLEALSEPGGIAVSGNVHEQIHGKTDALFVDDGSHEVKNIAKPVRVWRWKPARTFVGGMAPAADAAPSPIPDKPSIAVLPFDNMSSDSEHQFFADGISEDIITALSKISQMRVIARNSSFSYKGRADDLRQVANELGVRYVLGGSVRSGGNRLRITARLIDAADGGHVWAERFDRTIDDLFDIQDEITKQIVTALRVRLTDGEEALMWARGTGDIVAWQLCVQATELFMRFNATDFLQARSLAEKALERDADYAYAWATLGFTHWWDGRLGYTGGSQAKFVRARECADRAMALDDTVSWAIGLAVMVSGSMKRHDEGLAMARRGFELYPGNADMRAFLAFGLSNAGAHRDSIDHYRAAMSLNPFYPNWYRTGLSRALTVLGEFDEALAIADEILSLEPAHLVSWLQKAYMFGRRGRVDEANRALSNLARHAPDLRLEHVPGILLISDDATVRPILEGLREVGLPE